MIATAHLSSGNTVKVTSEKDGAYLLQMPYQPPVVMTKEDVLRICGALQRVSNGK